MNKRFKNQAARDLMSLTLLLDPTMRTCLRQMIRMGAYNIRPDYMYIMSSTAWKHEQVQDPAAWNGDIDAFGGRNNMGIMMLRTDQGEWFLNGC